MFVEIQRHGLLSFVVVVGPMSFLRITDPVGFANLLKMGFSFSSLNLSVKLTFVLPSLANVDGTDGTACCLNWLLADVLPLARLVVLNQISLHGLKFMNNSPTPTKASDTEFHFHFKIYFTKSSYN